LILIRAIFTNVNTIKIRKLVDLASVTSGINGVKNKIIPEVSRVAFTGVDVFGSIVLINFGIQPFALIPYKS
jgi:hypothetical protein